VSFAERLAIWVPTALVVAASMEKWAAVVHRVAWHGPLWRVHRSHHRRREGRFEANDGLSMTHAPVAIALVLWGCRAAPGPVREIAFGTGIGMSLFGVAHLLVHDGLVHGRLPVEGLLRLPVLGRYLRAVVEAHWIHHRDAARGAPYGLFLGPREAARAMRPLTHAKPRQSGRAPGSSAPPS
jgi:beta-carotene 3-hydroxylase